MPSVKVATFWIEEINMFCNFSTLSRINRNVGSKWKKEQEFSPLYSGEEIGLG